jgi:hypothetical protein
MAQRACVGGDAPVRPEPDATGIERAAMQGRTAEWLFRWEGPESSGWPSPKAGVPPELRADPAGPATAREIDDRLVLDLTMPATLRRPAADMSLATRAPCNAV